LELENANLRQRLAADAETQRDNEMLRRELGLSAAAVIKQINAEVVAAAPDSYRQYAWINKGSSDGFKNGLAVMSSGALVGVLSEVQAHSARVTLVSDPDFRLAAKDQDTNAAGIVMGQLGGGLVLEKIGQSDTVKPGDTVTTSGLGGDIPTGLFIGQIESVDAQSDVVFQSARLVSSIKPRDLRFVAVVLP
jgi:rod shape-determining protein MreC